MILQILQNSSRHQLYLMQIFFGGGSLSKNAISRLRDSYPSASFGVIASGASFKHRRHLGPWQMTTDSAMLYTQKAEPTNPVPAPVPRSALRRLVGRAGAGKRLPLGGDPRDRVARVRTLTTARRGEDVERRGRDGRMGSGVSVCGDGGVRMWRNDIGMMIMINKT